MKLPTIFVFCICAMGNATAYEIDTHARITYVAYASSKLNAQDPVRRLGLLKSRKVAPPTAEGDLGVHLGFGNKYYDPLRVGGADRYATAFDAENSWVMKAYRASKPQRRWFYSQFDGRDEPYFPVDWMARGAVRDDDTMALFANKAQYWDGEINAAQSLDAKPLLNRFCNHFYDPVADKALDLGFSPYALFACSQSEVFGAAPKWALGAVNNDGSGGVHAGRQNAFALPDAREAMWRALTGTNKDGVGVASTRTERDAWWATTFRALGSVIHNLQDMAQPQHTRNEPHALGEASLFEHVANERAMGVERAVRPAGLFATTTYVPAPPMQYDGYVAPPFAQYRHFFSSGLTPFQRTV